MISVDCMACPKGSANTGWWPDWTTGRIRPSSSTIQTDTFRQIFTSWSRTTTETGACGQVRLSEDVTGGGGAP